MHERSLVKRLLRQVEAICEPLDAECVTEVRIEVGPLSGVEPLLLQSAFEQLAFETAASEANLLIDEVPLRAKCTACGCDFEVGDFVFRCPDCGGNVRIIQGDEIQLVSVSLREPRCDPPQVCDPASHVAEAES